MTNLAMGNYVGAGTSAVNALTEKGTTTTIQNYQEIPDGVQVTILH